MEKVLLQPNEIPEMIKHCYLSDVDHMLKYHITADNGIEFCINRTVTDFIINDVKIYSLFLNKEFVGYFGEKDDFLTGFFIIPKFRLNHKEQVWSMIVDHFNGSFKIGIYSKNIPAKKFLLKNNCELIQSGLGEIYMYKENI